MKHLIFQPCFDVYHTEFRMLRLLNFVAGNRYHVDQIRIVDFYLLYFFRLTGVKLLRGHASIRSLAKGLSISRYEVQPDDKILFMRMSSIQSVALDTLASNGYILLEELRAGAVMRSDKPLPADLSERIDEANKVEGKIMKALQILLMDYQIAGADGLKARTGLLEHRYDSV